jgi:thiol-disulfide isomerase/thioredoxin
MVERLTYKTQDIKVKKIPKPRMMMMNKQYALLVVSCLSIISAQSVPLALTVQNFATTLKTDKPVLVSVSAGWCQACQQMKPAFEKFASDAKDAIVTSLNITAIPTFLVIKAGKVVGKIRGAFPYKVFADHVTALIKMAGKKLSELTKQELSLKLLDALESGSVADVDSVLAAGAPVNVPLANGMVPLSFVILGGSEGAKAGDMVSLLVKYGATTTAPILLPGTDKEISIEQFLNGALTELRSQVSHYESIQKALIKK